MTARDAGPPKAVGQALPYSTAHLILRRFVPADLRGFQSYRSDPGVGRFQGWSVQDDAGAACFLATMATIDMGVPGEWFQIAIEDRLTAKLVGDIGICVHAGAIASAEIGFTIAPSAQRRGFGTEAVRAALGLLFETGKIEQVEGITDARNVPSIHLLERVGMQIVRTQIVVFKGEHCTEVVYSIEKDRWAATETTNA